MQATPQQSSLLGMLDVQYHLRTHGCDVRLGPGELRGCRREHGSHWGRRDTVPLNVKGQLKGVDQKVYLLLIYETGQRPENQITTVGLVSRQNVEWGEQVTEFFNIAEGFFNCVALDSQPTKSVPRRLRLVIERNIDEMCPKRNSQSRMQHENLDVGGVGTTRLLRGVALFDETCDLTDEDAQEASIRACCSVNPGIIIVGIPRTASKSHFKFYITLCTWQHERGALYIMILTDSEDALSEEQFSALETLHRSEGSAWLGRGLRQAGTGARLESNLSAMNRARVWTMAEHIQQEAIAREGTLHSEELFHLLKTVIHGEALSHAMQFAQRLRDTADEELVTPLGNFVAAANRELDLAKELDRVDEAVEAEVDEETPSPSQQRQLLRAHVNLGRPAIGEFCRALRNVRCRRCCQMGKTLFQMPRVRSTTDAENSAGSSFAEILPFQSSLWHRHYGSSESVGSRKPNRNIARHLSWDTLPPGRTQAGHDGY